MEGEEEEKVKIRSTEGKDSIVRETRMMKRTDASIVAIC